MDSKNIMILAGEISSKVSMGETKKGDYNYISFHLKCHNGRKADGSFRKMIMTCKSFRKTPFEEYKTLRKGDWVTVIGEFRQSFKEGPDSKLQIEEFYIKIEDIQRLQETTVMEQQDLPVKPVEVNAQMLQMAANGSQQMMPQMMSQAGTSAVPSQQQMVQMQQTTTPPMMPFQQSAQQVSSTTMAIPPQQIMPQMMSQAGTCVVPSQQQMVQMQQTTTPPMMPPLQSFQTELNEKKATGTDGFVNAQQKGDNIPF